MTETPPTQPSDPLVAYLETLASNLDRAKLAALRSGLRADRRWDALRIVLPFVPDREFRAQREDDALLLAGLFALHPVSGSVSLARALRMAAEERDSQSMEARFAALLGAERRDLDDHLRHAVQLLANGKRPPAIDWQRFHRDLQRWNQDWVRRAWARDYWGTTSAALEPESLESAPFSDSTSTPPSES